MLETYLKRAEQELGREAFVSVVQDKYQALIRDFCRDTIPAAQKIHELTGIEPIVDERYVQGIIVAASKNEPYFAHHLNDLLQFTGVHLTLRNAHGMYQNTLSRLESKPKQKENTGGKSQLESFQFIQSMEQLIKAGYLPSEEFVQNAYETLIRLKDDRLSFNIKQIKNITGINPSEEMVAKAYSAVLDIAKREKKHVSSHLAFNVQGIQEITGINPSPDFVEKAYHAMIKYDSAKPLFTLNMGDIIKLTGIRPSETLIQEAYKSVIKFCNAYSIPNELSDLIKILKVKPLPGIVGEAYQSMFNREKDFEFTGIHFEYMKRRTGLSLPEDVVEPLYKKALSKRNLKNILWFFNDVSKLSGKRPSFETIQKLLGKCTHYEEYVSALSLLEPIGIKPTVPDDIIKKIAEKGNIDDIEVITQLGFTPDNASIQELYRKAIQLDNYEYLENLMKASQIMPDEQSYSVFLEHLNKPISEK